MRSARSLFILALLTGSALFAVRALQAGGDGSATVTAEVVGAPVPCDPALRAVRLTFSAPQRSSEAWEGSAAVSGGELVALRGECLGPLDRVGENSWRLAPAPVSAAEVLRKRLGPGIRDEEELEGFPGGDETPPAPARSLVAFIRAEGDATLQVVTPRERLAFQLTQQQRQQRQQQRQQRRAANGTVVFEDTAAHVQVTNTPADEDFPASAVGLDGAVWTAYVAHDRGNPISQEEMRQGRFDSLLTRGNGDQVRLTRFDGKQWAAPIAVSGQLLDVWRPSVAVDGAGTVWVVWAQGVRKNWDLYARGYDPATNRLGKVLRLTTGSGADLNPAVARDSQGRVWVAWQGWRDGQFDIWAGRLDNGGLRARQVSTSPANDWTPVIAAGPAGAVWIAWDTYDKGNYDVMARRIADDRMDTPVAVAASPRFEARASTAVDRDGRLWVAFEDAAPNWGKDYGTRWEGKSGSQFYLERFARVRCITDGRVQEVKAAVPYAPTNTTYPQGRNVRVAFPRIGFDAKGAPWLLFRQHAAANGAGERWVSIATRLSGDAWSEPLRLPESENLLDNRPALATVKDGLLVVYSGDGRTVGTQTMKENNLFAAVLDEDEAPRPPVLTAVNPSDGPTVEPVHPNETEEIRRIRGYRAGVGGKNYRLLRGEFHRHTEISSHRDQDGPFEEIWRYGLDVARMDWIGPGDHDNGPGQEYTWWLTQKQCEFYFHPDTFLPMFTYERSVVYPSGHRNVIFTYRGIRPLPRLGLGQGDGMGNNPQLFGTPEGGSPDVKNLYAYLRRFNGICSSHTSATNMGTDWRDNDPQVEPVVEVFQGHRQNYEEPNAPKAATGAMDSIGGYQPAGYIWNAFGKGYRLGFQVSSDHISTHISYAIVFAENRSREAILGAFKKRHSYGANDNIILDVRCQGHLMGDEFPATRLPRLEVFADGTAPITRIDIVRQLDREVPAYVYTTKPAKRTVKLDWTDTAAKPGAVNMYYVRIVQENGAMAWASPLWVHYQP